MRQILAISRAVRDGFYQDLGEIEVLETTLEELKIKVIPHEGHHASIEYIITLKWDEEWPLVFIDSEIFDRIKTHQYLQNRGKVGNHKGICIKNFSRGYSFRKNFAQLCDNKWENYLYYLITVFNNIQDFEKGNGFRSNYKEILQINGDVTTN